MKNKILTGLALVLAILALVVGNPLKSGDSVETTNIAIDKVESNRVNDFDVEKLADWIIKGNRDYKLVDLRNEDKYNEFFIPGAMNLPMDKFSKDYFLKTDKIILYSDDDNEAAEAWLKLEKAGYKAIYIIYGGTETWKNEVLFPKRPPNASGNELLEFNKRAETALYFGGKPYGYSPGVAPQKAAPAAPAPPAGAPAKKKNPKIGGGC